MKKRLICILLSLLALLLIASCDHTDRNMQLVTDFVNTCAEDNYLRKLLSSSFQGVKISGDKSYTIKSSDIDSENLRTVYALISGKEINSVAVSSVSGSLKGKYSSSSSYDVDVDQVTINFTYVVKGESSSNDAKLVIDGIFGCGTTSVDKETQQSYVSTVTVNGSKYDLHYNLKTEKSSSGVVNTVFASAIYNGKSVKVSFLNSMLVLQNILK